MRASHSPPQLAFPVGTLLCALTACVVQSSLEVPLQFAFCALTFCLLLCEPAEAAHSFCFPYLVCSDVAKRIPLAHFLP